ncbi:MAG: orotate phosphoribosyltransferase [Candidatus Levybacteria bacterium]|nr:orotate phosphoribosyltransferase [Candidatus Levybacteria bacterium]
MDSSRRIAKLLLSIDAVTISPDNPYRYSSGILSPVYSDMRLLVSYPTERKIVINELANIIKGLGKCDILAGTSTAGIPHAAFLAMKLDMPMVYVRGKAKDHGKKSQIEGLFKKGQRAIIIEDLISTGGSSLETLEALKHAGGKVKNIVAIFTYTMPISVANMKKAGIKLTTLTTFPQVVDMAVKMGKMKEKDKQTVLDWLKDPAGWGKKMGFEK